ncbi:MAG: TatA/E family twin arginine-targeting protein translocase [Prochlorococcaceae cyanobacterium]|jgi:sec-independent protein translocase protein TatA
MNFFGIGLPELAVIAAIGLLVFGPKRLPELGKTLGRTLKGFQSASQEFEKEFRTAIATEPEPASSAGEPQAPALAAAAPSASEALALVSEASPARESAEPQPAEPASPGA